MSRRELNEINEAGLIHVMRLRVPLVLALGWYEQLTDEQLRDHMQDLKVEAERRHDERY